MTKGKKRHRYLDAMRPATRISVPYERNRKESTLQKWENTTNKKGNEARAKRGKRASIGGHQCVDMSVVVFVSSLSARSITSIEYRNTGY